MNKKVLFVANDSSTYGSNRSTLNLIDELIKKNITIKVLIPEKGALEEELKSRNIEYKVGNYYSGVMPKGEKGKIKLWIKAICNYLISFKIAKWVKQEKITIIHSVNSAVFIGAHISKLTKIIHVWHIRELMQEDHNFEFFNKKIAYRLLNTADYRIYISKAVQDKYKKILNSENSKLIYNGIAENGKCTKTGLDTQIGNKIRYNNPYNKFEAVGYAYNGSHTLTAIVSTKIKNEVVFANDVEYKDGIYILKDQYIKDDNFETSREDILKTHHYTCLKTANETCSSIYYVFMSRDKLIFYTTLKNGETVESLIENEIINGNNSKSSTIKNYIDNWYNQNMSSYTENLEDAIWCNDRTFYSGTLKSKDTSSTSFSYFGSYGRIGTSLYKPSVTCPEPTRDGFTVNQETGGNGLLKYPVGLLTADEIMLAGGKGGSSNSSYYLYTKQNYWSLSPYCFNNNNAYGFNVYSDGYLNNYNVGNSVGVRPSVSLKSGTRSIDGEGTPESPYIIE